jgi:hypothetical protein
MRLSRELPDARPQNVDFICYGSRRLCVSVLKRSARRRKEVDPIFGDYTYGCIRLMPCLHCTYAFMTRTYLHELFHAWAHQYHNALYDRWDHCRTADNFADYGFQILGGRKWGARDCLQHSLNVPQAIRRLPVFSEAAQSLHDLPPAKLRGVAWRLTTVRTAPRFSRRDKCLFQ